MSVEKCQFRNVSFGVAGGGATNIDGQQVLAGGGGVRNNVPGRPCIYMGRPCIYMAYLKGGEGCVPLPRHPTQGPAPLR